MEDYLHRNREERKTYVVPEGIADSQFAQLRYQVIGKTSEMSLVRIKLLTGRTHQIRAQFSSRDLPLVGDRKYSLLEDDCPIALWSCRLAFTHPVTGEPMEFSLEPPDIYPWSAC